jgi:hypothetical protein
MVENVLSIIRAARPSIVVRPEIEAALRQFWESVRLEKDAPREGTRPTH